MDGYEERNYGRGSATGIMVGISPLRPGEPATDRRYCASSREVRNVSRETAAWSVSRGFGSIPRSLRDPRSAFRTCR